MRAQRSMITWRTCATAACLRFAASVASAAGSFRDPAAPVTRRLTDLVSTFGSDMLRLRWAQLADELVARDTRNGNGESASGRQPCLRSEVFT